MRRRGRIIVSNGQIAQNGASVTKCVVLRHDALAERQFLREIVDEQRPAVVEKVARLLVRLLLHLVRQAAGRPDLAVRMRVRAAHDLAAVLENLHRADVGARRRD